MSKCDERFARQYRYEPPPGFPLASPSSDIVHHLSGPNRCANTQTSRLRIAKSVGSTHPRESDYTFHLHSAHTVSRHALAHVCGLLGPCFKTGHLKPFGTDAAGSRSWSRAKPTRNGTACRGRFPLTSPAHRLCGTAERKQGSERS